MQQVRFIKQCLIIDYSNCLFLAEAFLTKTIFFAYFDIVASQLKLSRLVFKEHRSSTIAVENSFAIVS